MLPIDILSWYIKENPVYIILAYILFESSSVGVLTNQLYIYIYIYIYICIYIYVYIYT